MAIGRLAGEGEARRLRAVLDHYLYHPSSAKAAALALAMIGDESAMPQVRAMLGDADFEHRANRRTAVAWVGMALAGLGDWESLPQIRTPIEAETYLQQKARAKHARRAAKRKQESKARQDDKPKGTIGVSVRLPPGWQPDPCRPPTISLPELAPAMTPDEAREVLEEWWAERRAYRLPAGGPPEF